MQKGTIKKVVADKGFGFIRDEAGTEWFFHKSAVSERVDFNHLQEGDRVTFHGASSPKGPRAEDVQLV